MLTGSGLSDHAAVWIILKDESNLSSFFSAGRIFEIVLNELYNTPYTGIHGHGTQAQAMQKIWNHPGGDVSRDKALCLFSTAANNLPPRASRVDYLTHNFFK